jgi:hypothetical protein
MIMVTASKERITRIELAKRAIQSGVITPKEMKGAIIITSFYLAICHIIDLFCL